MQRDRSAEILAWRHNHWPDIDRRAWRIVNQPGDDFEGAGRASTWTADSRRNVEQAYGRFLGFLQRSGGLRPVACVGDRLELAQIRLFSEELAKNVAPSTLWGILQALCRAFSAMAPETDRSSFNKVLTRVKRRARLNRQLDGRLIDPVALIAVATRMMDAADSFPLNKKAAVLYRNGAIIMAATCCPLRRSAWGKVLIGHHLQLIGDRGRIAFEAGELKATRRPFEAELPRELVVRLRRYISRYRPLLMPPSKRDRGALWLARFGEPLRGDALSSAVTRTLTKCCGKRFGFHMFRHAAATFIADHAPNKSLMAAGVLHHASLRTTMAHYVMGQRTAALRAYQSCVHAIARKARKGEHYQRKHRLPKLGAPEPI